MDNLILNNLSQSIDYQNYYFINLKILNKYSNIPSIYLNSLTIFYNQSHFIFTFDKRGLDDLNYFLWQNIIYILNYSHNRMIQTK